MRLYRTRQRQDFHTDGSDIVGLLCLQRAMSGGESRIASSLAVYNEILLRRPELLEVLYEPMYWDRNNEQSHGEEPYFALPVLNVVDGAPRMFYIGWYIRDAQRHPEVPRLTDPQQEALDLIESIANDLQAAFHLEMDFEPGDVQLLANAKILHCREAYDDHEDPDRRRHLLRLWLTAHTFASVDGVFRGGIPNGDTSRAGNHRRDDMTTSESDQIRAAVRDRYASAARAAHPRLRVERPRAFSATPSTTSATPRFCPQTP